MAVYKPAVYYYILEDVMDEKRHNVHNYNLWICGGYYSLLSGVCVTMCFMIYQLVFTPLPWFLNIKFYQL